VQRPKVGPHSGTDSYRYGAVEAGPIFEGSANPFQLKGRPFWPLPFRSLLKSGGMGTPKGPAQLCDLRPSSNRSASHWQRGACLGPRPLIFTQVRLPSCFYGCLFFWPAFLAEALSKRLGTVRSPKTGLEAGVPATVWAIRTGKSSKMSKAKSPQRH